MTSEQKTHWMFVQDVVKTIPEEGPLERWEVDTWAWWMHVMVNCFEQRGWTYRGASIRYDGWSTLLVVKGAHEGTRYVVFLTERSTTHCMRAFRRQLEEGRVEWREDRFG